MPSPADYATMIREVTEGMGLEVILEPGRVIAGNAGVLVTETLFVKPSSQRNFLVVDAGMNDLMRPALYQAHHDMVPLRERAEVTARRLSGIEGISCVPPRAAFYAMPKVELPPGRTDEDYVVGLLRATGLLCVYGSGFGTAPGDGFFRIVFLAAPPELEAIYDTIAAFTERFRARG